MKKTIWILFLALTLIWTAFAFLAAGLARWTSDAIASDRFAETTQYMALTSERVAQKLSDSTGRVSEQVAATVTQTIGEGQPQNEASTSADAAAAASAPILPPLPEWANQWLAPEMVQSIEEWGVWAKSAANASKAAVSDAANASARAVPETASLSTTITDDAAAQASKAADAPWLADVAGWLVPIVWVIWGIGLALGLVLALIAQWGVNRFFGDSSFKPATPH
jgi:hypothetical protein